MLTVNTSQNPSIHQNQQQEDSLKEWQKEFNRHFATIPYTYTKKWPSLPATLGAKYPYELGLSQMLELPLPSSIHSYIKTHAVSAQLQLSLFDLESGHFFGDTWLGNADTLVSLKSGNSKNAHVKMGSPLTLNASESNSPQIRQSESPNIVSTPSGSIESVRMNIHYKNLCFYMHSPVTSPHVIAVIEVVFIGIL